MEGLNDAVVAQTEPTVKCALPPAAADAMRDDVAHALQDAPNTLPPVRCPL